jgi:hypothetical protein
MTLFTGSKLRLRCRVSVIARRPYNRALMALGAIATTGGTLDVVRSYGLFNDVKTGRVGIAVYTAAGAAPYADQAGPLPYPFLSPFPSPCLTETPRNRQSVTPTGTELCRL